MELSHNVLTGYLEIKTIELLEQRVPLKQTKRLKYFGNSTSIKYFGNSLLLWKALKTTCFFPSTVLTVLGCQITPQIPTGIVNWILLFFSFPYLSTRSLQTLKVSSTRQAWCHILTGWTIPSQAAGSQQ